MNKSVNVRAFCVDLTYLLETGNSQGLKGVDKVNQSPRFFVPKRICLFPDEDNKAQKSAKQMTNSKNTNAVNQQTAVSMQLFEKVQMVLLFIAVSISLLSCSGKPKERVQEAAYTFDINQEVGYNWNYTMVDVHNKNFNNKTYKTYNTVDNYKASDDEAMGAFFLDLASQLLLKESLGLSEDQKSQEWTDGPTIYCGPVKYRHVQFDYVIYKSKAAFCGTTPQMNYATLGNIEYAKQYEDEDDKEKAEEFYQSLVDHFNAGGLQVIESNDDYTKWSDGTTQVGVYLHYVMEGMIWKDSIPCINVDFSAVDQFPQTQKQQTKSGKGNGQQGKKASATNTVSSTSSFDGKYGFTSTRLVTVSELSNYDNYELRIMRNEIFARHGYIFKKGGEMENYFKQQSWYTPKYTNVDKYLSNIEIQNIATIKNVESQRR